MLKSLLNSMCCSVALLRRAASSVLSVVPQEYRWSLVWERSQLVMAARLCNWQRIARLVVCVFGKMGRFFVSVAEDGQIRSLVDNKCLTLVDGDT